MSYLEAKEKYSAEFEKMHTKGKEYDDSCYPNGETRRQVRKRVFDGLEYWASNNSYNKIAISSHGIMLSQILFMLGEKQTDIPNGSILHIRKNNNIWAIIEWL